MKKNRWVGFARFAIIILMLVLFANCLSLFLEVKRDVLYGSRSYGLSTLNDYFDEGRYQQIYNCAISNKYADDELAVDASQYEAFGRYYRAYTLARTNEDNAEYLRQMEEEKAQISWKKILDVIDTLEAELN
ncbi:MAG: hypothetical protein J5528_05900 [Firmicutes bacterium]|nr:hypothetical protein [Bacillota bacterium]